MATTRYRRCVSRVARAAAAVAVTVATAAVPAGGAPGPGAGEDARARRAALLVHAAELADRVQSAEAAVVASQLAHDSASARLLTLRDRRRERAVTAYMRGTGASVAALSAPRAYLDVLAAKERELVAGHRRAVEAAADGGRRAEATRRSLREDADRLAAVQAELDLAVAAHDARQAEEQRRADEARRAALARRAAEQARARGPAQAGAAPPPGAYAPSPLDPQALVPRHRVATDRQAALMRRVPFGVLAPGAALPAGLAATGRHVEGEASWYGPGFNGRPTASGAIYDQEAWTVASPDLPLGTFLVVTRGERRVLLLVNDRGPYVDGRVLDLSAAAARALGVGGVASVRGEVVGGA